MSEIKLDQLINASVERMLELAFSQYKSRNDDAEKGSATGATFRQQGTYLE
jgi:hypothetical protein